jgi:carbonic anhydrase/acetyltransferase-like protein (isoleucine patch superfamily)
MLIRHRDHEPEVDPTAFIAPTAVLVGRVKVGPRACVMYGAVLNAEDSRIEVGEYTIINENAVIRANRSEEADYPVLIGDHVFIGPQATLVGCTLKSCTYVATGAVVLQGSTVHSGALVTVGAVVHVQTVVKPDLFIPPNTIAIGNPAVIYSPDEKVTLAGVIKHARFGSLAFGVEARPEDRLALYRQATEARSRKFESHHGDTILSGPAPGKTSRKRKAD